MFNFCDFIQVLVFTINRHPFFFFFLTHLVNCKCCFTSTVNNCGHIRLPNNTIPGQA